MSPRSYDVAVVGMACAFPGAPDLGRYWANVVAGTDAVTEVPPDRWSADRHWAGAEAAPGEQSPSRWGGFLPPLPFDALAHGVPPASLGGIEPAQLLALDTADRALADAGYRERPFDRETTSVIFAAEAGADLASAYAARSVLGQHLDTVPEELDARLPRLTEDSFPGTLANVIAGRIANRLDLGGPTYTVDAACASSLAALDQACKELLAGTSDMVLCGAVDTHNGLHDHLLFGSVRALSPTGRCRAFDASADGIVLAEGVACLVLKRLADAERDGDRVYAVIKAVGAGSDGRGLGLTAPRPEGQRRALGRAYALAGVSPREVGLVEAHGTGTVLGDRTELETLTEVFRTAGARPGACSLGSVKSLIGHAKCAAGMAGLIKAVLAVHTGVRPPTRLTEPNAAWDPATSPFVFDTAARPWTEPHRVAGVSAFGFGGVNYHAVVAAPAPGPAPAAAPRPAGLLLFRGTEDEVRAALRNLAGRLDEGTVRRCAPTGVTGTGPTRVALVTEDITALRGQLDLALSLEDRPERGVHVGDGSRQPVALLFPGQGSQRPGMLADLFVAFPRLHRFLRADPALTGALFPPAAFGGEVPRLVDTRLAQPALGLGGLAALDLLRACGVEADMTAGHSYGELPALAAAGALPEEAVLPLSGARAEAMHTAAGDDPGAMAAVAAPAGPVAELLARHGLADDVTAANHNAPGQLVLAGSAAGIDAAVAVLGEAGHTVKRLPVAAAFHSPRMAPAVDAFAAALAGHDLSAPRLPVWSGATARPYPADPEAIRTLLAGALARPVRFAEQIEDMYAAGVRVFVEAGPGTVLTRLVGEVLAGRPHTALSVEAPGRPGLAHLLGTLAALAVRGTPVRLEALTGDHTAGYEQDRAPAGWTVDGHLVRTADGTPVPGGLQPTGPPVTLTGGGTGAGRDETVIEFLRGTQRIVAAQQEVVLRYLGTDAPAARPPAETAPPQPAETAAPAVLDVVAARTGYPPAMLDPDLDLEAALGVDSLKRTEIATALLRGTPHADAVGQLADLRTIRSMTDWLTTRTGPGAPTAAATEPAPRNPPAATAASDPQPAPQARPAAVRGGIAPEPSRRPAAVRDGIEPEPDNPSGAVSRAAGHSCEGTSAGYPPTVRHVVEPLPEERPAGPAVTVPRAAVSGGGEVGDVLAALLKEGGTELVSDPAGCDALLLLDALDGGDGVLPGRFAAIRAAVLGGIRTLLLATCHDAGPAGGGLHGLARAVSREHPGLAMVAVDLPAGQPPEEAARTLLAELGGARPSVTHTAGRRAVWHTRPAPLPDREVSAGDLHLDRDGVVLLTGGARGITARLARALATLTGCHIELVGRSAPVDGPRLTDAELRARLIAEGERDPAGIERAVRAHAAGRQVRQCLDDLTGRAASVRYHRADVRDAEHLGAVLDDVYNRHGRLDTVVHAAGLVRDRLLCDKTPEEFAEVYDTKVAGARALAARLRPGLRHLVLFGSIAGVTGNRGQSDYAAANDALDTLARQWSGRLADRVLALDWGPWAADAGGMVTAELERAYVRNGIRLIDPDDGVRAFLRELAFGNDPQVLLAAGDPAGFGSALD
ncbi:type I polyketide synthase [Streptomyces sp. TRM70350]|uniref:type I polyketide synthase n=1 Tax=Streptomyces sp. TRM70350 TaxID=2856165 RepID=UPI001C44764B|nr:type I polyketide synthase [Streptomyces sp. TRM70350]MBV7700667.1 SDR family NAD(P)-dependent oxidoreductase [Streptomyces sp. TRM70350]